MVLEHHWTECRPALLTLTGGNPIESALYQAVIERIWFEFPDEDRQAFHRACCHNSRAFADLAAMQRIVAALNHEMDEM